MNVYCGSTTTSSFSRPQLDDVVTYPKISKTHGVSCVLEPRPPVVFVVGPYRS